MRELIISDLTEMGPGLCVIGVEAACENVFRSIRPMPPAGYAWERSFPHQRGNGVRFDSCTTSVLPPHLEDQKTEGLQANGRSLNEIELVDMLQRAEVATELEGLFGCELHMHKSGGNAWVEAGQAARSICGCVFRNLRFLVFSDPNRVTLRARIVLTSGETLNSLPVVDWQWRCFMDEVMVRIANSERRFDLDRYLNRFIRQKLLQSLHGFARVGLARPDAGNKSWLMLDSLFPQPDPSWLDIL